VRNVVWGDCDAYWSRLLNAQFESSSARGPLQECFLFSDDSLYSLLRYKVNEKETCYQGRLFDVITVNGSQFVESCVG
jgi:hypothetical protein